MISETEFNKKRSHKDITKKDLKRLFYNENLNCKEIGEYYNCHKETIRRRLKKYNMKTQYDIVDSVTKGQLEYLYHRKSMTQKEVAQRLGICKPTIIKKMKEFNIRTKYFDESKVSKEQMTGLYIEKNYTQEEIGNILGCGKHNVKHILDKFNIKSERYKASQISKRILLDLYTNKEKTMKEIADKFGVSSSTVLIKIKKYNIKRRGCLRSLKSYKKEVFDNVGKEFDVLGDYTGIFEKIKIKHNLCNNVFEIVANNFRTRYSCPYCNESKGEAKVRRFLDKHKIPYKKEYWFDDCRHKYPLPFDFVIFDNNKLNCLIEYDGKFHYITVEGFYDEKQLVYKQKCDKIKNDYCKENGLKLIRIPYWEYENIEKILNRKLDLKSCQKNKRLTLFEDFMTA